MAVFFFDTSALVKRYHRELGTDAVDAAFENADATKIISDTSVIEFYSAFAKKVRTGTITEEDFQVTVRALAKDIQGGTLKLVRFGDYEKREAGMLISKYGLYNNLRTLDAMQLAIMKKLGTQSIFRVYCSDRAFSGLIEREGFAVVDPEIDQVRKKE